jgi:hypothetical protein
MTNLPRDKKVISIYGAFLFVTALSAFLYPPDWTWPLALAAVFGPFTAMRLGFPEGLIFLFVCIGLAVPFIFRNTPIRIILLLISLGIWAFVGYSAGEWMYA